MAKATEPVEPTVDAPVEVPSASDEPAPVIKAAGAPESHYDQNTGAFTA